MVRKELKIFLFLLIFVVSAAAEEQPFHEEKNSFYSVNIPAGYTRDNSPELKAGISEGMKKFLTDFKEKEMPSNIDFIYRKNKTMLIGVNMFCGELPLSELNAPINKIIFDRVDEKYALTMKKIETANSSIKNRRHLLVSISGRKSELYEYICMIPTNYGLVCMIVITDMYSIMTEIDSYNSIFKTVSIDKKYMYEEFDKPSNVPENAVWKKGYWVSVNSEKGEIVMYYRNGARALAGGMNEKGYDGIVRVWNINGKLRQEAEYKNGVMEGLSKFYDGEGRIIKTEQYREGKLIAATHEAFDNTWKPDIVMNVKTRDEGKDLELINNFNRIIYKASVTDFAKSCSRMPNVRFVRAEVIVDENNYFHNLGCLGTVTMIGMFILPGHKTESEVELIMTYDLKKGSETVTRTFRVKEKGSEFFWIYEKSSKYYNITGRMLKSAEDKIRQDLLAEVQ